MGMTKTPAGQQVIRDRSVPLTQRQRAALILFDGRRGVEEVLAATAAAGVTAADIDRLVQAGLIADEAGASGPAPLSVSVATPPEPDVRYLRAYKTAIQLTGELGPRHGHLLLAVEAAEGIEELTELAPRLRAALLPLKFARFEAALLGR